MAGIGKYRILILTDHRIHSPVESIYRMAQKMSQWDLCEHIHVVSRGLPENEAFFSAPTDIPLTAIEVSRDFYHSEEGKAFGKEQFLVSPLDYEVVMLRLPRVNSMTFFSQIGQLIPPHRIINQPEGIIRTGSKEYLQTFSAYSPPMRICRTVGDILDFKAQFPIVLKPFNNSGGKGIIRLDGDMAYRGHEVTTWAQVLPTIKEEIQKGYLAVKFLKNVSQGDKRIIVVNGEIVSAALRIPQKGSWLCNVSMGAHSIQAAPDKNELEIVNRVAPELLKQGVVLFGMDTLVDDTGKRVLSELNTSCVNGIYPAELASGRPVVQHTVDKLADYISSEIDPQT